MLAAAGAPPEVHARRADHPSAAATSVMSTTAVQTRAPANGATSARTPVSAASAHARRSEANAATTVGSMPRKYGVDSSGAMTISTTRGATASRPARSRRRRDESMPPSLTRRGRARTVRASDRDEVSLVETPSHDDDVTVTEARYGVPHAST
ncbi:hypothetical protein GCM10023216_10390 [Isoptericola chiayiensis]|uniref:Uncharacterized protein n=1 Tax=Isoptericola chiayiensis TaxID=579446 RepID=A0ABP8Y9W6_9MICO